MWQKTKLAGVAVLALLLVIVVLQNTDAVETRILFVTVTMPRAALLFSAVLLGFFIGLLSAKWLTFRRAG